MNILENIGQAQMNAVTEQRAIPEFGPGDTLKINVKVVEGSRERVQAFEGVCIGRSNRGINSSFTVRKISYGCLLYTSPSPRDKRQSRMPSSA